MVRLEMMREAVFADYLAQAVEGYAAEHVRAGNWEAEEALAKSAKTYADLLPNGVASPNQYVWEVWDGATAVGMIWLAVMGGRPFGFIYDFIIYEAHRRQGYGEQALLAVDAKAKELGLAKIGLHVFAHNEAAHKLYLKMGYADTDINMAKVLS